MEEIIIPRNIREIQKDAFKNCKCLRKVTFEEGSMLNRIACGAFQNCSSLKNILFPDGLEEIGLDAFEESGLESIAFPASLRTVR